MNTRLIWLLLTIPIVAPAKEVKVREAWTRTFPGTSLAIMPDNLGKILAVGSESDSTFAVLLNNHGKISAKQPIPIPSATGVAADAHGRLFVMGDAWPTAVRCMSFAPSSSGPCDPRRTRESLPTISIGRVEGCRQSRR